MIESAAPNIIRGVVEQFVREELSHENAQIAGAVWSMLDAGGKGLRPRITMLAALTCDANAVEDPLLASYMELIHDDVVDNADLRRGRDSTNSVHGNRFSVLAGDYLFAWVFKKITQGYENPIPTILAAMLSDICNGEVKQLRATGNLGLGRPAYEEIIGKKTAELFASCAEVGAIAALQRMGNPSSPALRHYPVVVALRRYGHAFGMAFQMRDDVLDVIADEASLGKPAGSDLRERKVTLPLILALERRDAPLRALAQRVFAEPAGDGAASVLLPQLISALRAPQARQRAAAVIKEHEQQARTALADLPPSQPVSELAALTRGLSEFSC
ncbi:MAG: polyprenyl synthetase family protein [Candidatus Eremiobacteraeota bacterium]|nr:polyprenyl synthetase family protein [Candidatus Eremiobacteraeota bacterium]